MLLKLDQLTAAYGQAIALEKIQLQIQPGELVAILGPNGAGKSTLLKVISRAMNSHGTLEFNGQSLHTYSTEQVVGLGICHCPEGRRLFPELSVMKNLQLGAYLRTNRQEVENDSWIIDENSKRTFGQDEVLSAKWTEDENPAGQHCGHRADSNTAIDKYTGPTEGSERKTGKNYSKLLQVL